MPIAPDSPSRAAPLRDLQGRRIVLTGATAGIGRAAAHALGQMGAELVLVSRDRATGEALARRIGGGASFVRADLASLDSVRAAAREIRARGPIDVLVNNAGARFDHYASAGPGIERTFATNHLGHFALTSLLLDQVLAAAAGRIITVTSGAATAAANDGTWQFTALAAYDRRQAYAKAKLANLQFALELDRRLAGTGAHSLAVDPGLVATHFARNNGLLPWLKHLVYHGLKRELVGPRRGADTIVFLAAAELDFGKNPARLFRGRQAVEPCAAARDDAARSQLWRLSVELAGLGPSLGPAWEKVKPNPAETSRLAPSNGVVKAPRMDDSSPASSK